MLHRTVEQQADELLQNKPKMSFGEGCVIIAGWQQYETHIPLFPAVSLAALYLAGIPQAKCAPLLLSVKQGLAKQLPSWEGRWRLANGRLSQDGQTGGLSVQSGSSRKVHAWGWHPLHNSTEAPIAFHSCLREQHTEQHKLSRRYTHGKAGSGIAPQQDLRVPFPSTFHASPMQHGMTTWSNRGPGLKSIHQTH